jgi:peptide/nickel transport system permease protein
MQLDPGTSADAYGQGEIAAAQASTPQSEEDLKYKVSKTKRLGIGGWLAIGWLVFLFLFMILVPILVKPPTDRGALQDLGFLKDVSRPFGGDDNGNDLTRLMAEGVRNSLFIAFGAVGFGMIVGGFLGLVAGYFRRRLDTVLTMLFNVFLAIPQFILAVALVTVLASNHYNAQGISVPPTYAQKLFVLCLALGLVSIPILGRITRANTLQWSQREFVTAAKAQGAGNFRIIVREVLPNVLPAMFSIALLAIAVVIVVEGALEIFGVGMAPNAWTLGGIISSGRNGIAINPHIVFEPVIFIFLTVLSLNYLGDVVRARFDVRESVL